MLSFVMMWCSQDVFTKASTKIAWTFNIQNCKKTSFPYELLSLEDFVTTENSLRQECNKVD